MSIMVRVAREGGTYFLWFFLMTTRLYPEVPTSKVTHFIENSKLFLLKNVNFLT